MGQVPGACSYTWRDDGIIGVIVEDGFFWEEYERRWALS